MNAFAHIQQTIAFTLCAIAFTACTKDELVAPNAPGQHVQGPGQAETRMLNNESDQFGRTDMNAQAAQNLPGVTRMLNDERDQFGRTDSDAHAPQNFPGNTRMLNNERDHIGRSDGPMPPDFLERPQVDLEQEAMPIGSASMHSIEVKKEVPGVVKPAEVAPMEPRTSMGRAMDEKPAPHAGEVDGSMPILLLEDGSDQVTN